ncbi:MAG: restriction endonuclease subunit S, partial [Ignavibacteria bacterium]|nr:restriction endonuclease subunit S [Ignavibacteria bacterium]
MVSLQKVKLGNIFKLEYGKGLIAEKRTSGLYPVYGSSGCIGSHNEYLIEGPGIIVGRKGSVGEIYFSKKNFFPIDTAYYISKNDSKYNIRFLYYFLKTQNIKRLQGDVGVPGLNRETVHNEIVSYIDNLTIQARIASILSSYDELIENNEMRIKSLEEMAQLLYAEWFVKFKFPGHEKMKIID